MTPVLQTRGLVKRFDGLLATDHVDLDLRAGEIHALIGPNGAGKSTLINQICGELAHDEGSILLEGQPIDALTAPQRAQQGIGRTFQIVQLIGEASVLDNVALVEQVRQGRTWRLFDGLRGRAGIRASAMERLSSAGLADRAGTRVLDLSHGERKQVELVMACTMQPRLLLLDEPMAGLGQSESAAMVTTLDKLRHEVPILLIEHDMDAVFALADRISVLVYGRIVATGTADTIRNDPEVRRAYLGEEDAA